MLLESQLTEEISNTFLERTLFLVLNLLVPSPKECKKLVLWPTWSTGSITTRKLIEEHKVQTWMREPTLKFTTLHSKLQLTLELDQQCAAITRSTRFTHVRTTRPLTITWEKSWDSMVLWWAIGELFMERLILTFQLDVIRNREGQDSITWLLSKKLILKKLTRLFTEL